MEIIRLCPFSVATIIWGEHPSGHRLTICVKGTFVLTHRADAMIASQQDSVHGDISWDHNPQASLFAPSDFVPYKPKIDVLFSGRAFAPGGTPVDSLATKLQVGPLRKTLRVMGPRVWMEGNAGLSPSVPERFATAPIRYELASMTGENRNGIQQVGTPGWPLPRIEAVDAPSDKLYTPGFGPLPIRWRSEHYGLTDDGLTFVRRMRSQLATAPENFPFSVFNSAPIEQQLDEIEPAPTIVLEHLGRKAHRLESRLPAIRPRAFVRAPESSTNDEVDMRLDTIFIDGVRLVAVLSWRGSVPVSSIDAARASRIVVAAESPEMMVSPEDIESPPFNYEDMGSNFVLPRPFEGEAPDDEGYTLLPTRPARQEVPEPSASTPSMSAAAGSAPVIPQSGERRIDARTTKVVVGDVMSPSRELVDRATLAPQTIPDAAPFVTEHHWDAQADWRTKAEAAGPSTPRTGTIPGAAVDAAPATARTGAGAVVVEQAPPTQRPGVLEASGPQTPRAGTMPPPDTLPTHVVVAVRSDRRPLEISVSGKAPISGTADSQSGAIAVSAVQSSKPTSMKVEAVKSSSGQRPTTTMPMMPLADVPLEVCAAVAARIERRPAERADILQEMGLSVSMFGAAERVWAAAIRGETEQGRSDLRAHYDRCYVAQLELERGTFDALDYVRLMVGVEHGELEEVLAEFDVPQVALVRIERVWRERMQAEPSLTLRIRQAMPGARRAFSQSQRIPSIPET